jgi:trimeric autotransporter adhesin
MFYRWYGTVLFAGAMAIGLSQAAPDRVNMTFDDRNATYPVRIDPTITDVDWIGVGQSAYFYYDTDYDRPHYAVDSSGNIYVAGGGLFTGGLRIRTIAKWDHRKWSEVTAGIDGSQIAEMAFDKNGNLYVGYEGYRNDSVINAFFCKWNGTAWDTCGEGFIGSIFAMVFDGNGTLYTGCWMAGDPYVSVKKWDGTVWSTIGIMPNGNIYGMAAGNEGSLYVCGRFDTVDGIPANSIAKWSNGTWSALGSGLRSVPAEFQTGTAFVSRITVIGNDVYACGDFDSAGTIPVVNYVAKWDGNAWGPLAIDNLASADHVEGDGRGNAYLSGSVMTDGIESFVLAKWDGASWSILDKGKNYPGWLPPMLMIDKSANIYEMRDWTFMQWKGDRWSPVCSENGFNGQVHAMLYDIATGSLYVGGEFGIIGDKSIKNIARWDGSSWNALGDGPDRPVDVLAMNKNGILYAGYEGGHWSIDTLSILSKWDGTTWSSITTLIPDKIGKWVNRWIGDLACDDKGDLYVGGGFDSIGGRAFSNIAKWDGTAWSSLGNGISGVYGIQKMAFDKHGDLYVCGNFDSAGSIVAHNIAKWDGTGWSALGSGILKDPDSYEPVKTLLFDKDDNLYAGGDFNTAGDVEAHNIAKWDGTRWSALGDGIQSSDSNGCLVNALAIDDDGVLYAGGRFMKAGTAESYGIAKWDGTAWGALGSGLLNRTDLYWYDNYGSAHALACTKGMLYIAGGFITAGGKTSLNFAYCNVNGVKAESHCREKVKPLLTYECAKGLVCMHFTTGTTMHISVYSLSGREVYRASEFMTQGDHTFRIKTTGLAQGAYVAQVKAGNESLRYRFFIGR